MFGLAQDFAKFDTTGPGRVLRGVWLESDLNPFPPVVLPIVLGFEAGP